MSKVSVIIPCYNCEAYIEETIDSVTRQTYPSTQIELILINDGSTDQTAKILDTYANYHKVIHTANFGVSHARNIGLSYATGNYIQYLDSDDLLEPSKIEVQVNALIQNSADVAYGNWCFFKKINGQILKGNLVKKSVVDDEVLTIFTDFWCPPAAILYSRTIVEKIGQWKQWLPIIQDARYFLDAALQKGKFIYTDALMALYRENNPNSLSKKEKEFAIDCIKNCVDIYQHKWYKEKFDIKNESICLILLNAITILRKYDSKYYSYAIKKLLKINKNFIPAHKGYLTKISLLIGFKSAEFLARLKTKIF